MVPTQDTSSRGRSPARGNNTVDDDDWSGYSDSESIASFSTVSYDFPTMDRQECAPGFRLKENEQDRPVYEAWNIDYYPEEREVVESVKVLGVKVENYQHIASSTHVTPQPSTQSELAAMHLRGLEDFRAKHKRCWATRPFRRKGKTYEQDLEERCRRLPSEVQDAITQLLLDRGNASSTRYRTRTWTVVVVREQLRRRFAQPDFTEVKQHKLRFWKKRGTEEPLRYTVVIRGVETKACVGEECINSFAPRSNPWMQADNAEIRRRLREERDRRDSPAGKRRVFSPPYYRTRDRARSLSPPAYRSRRGRYASPAPSSLDYRYESPPPYRRCTRSESPLPSPSPSARIRVMPRYDPRPFDEAPFPPTPPESYTPPPLVSAYYRPSATAPAPPFPPAPAPYYTTATTNPPYFLPRPAYAPMPLLPPRPCPRADPPPSPAPAALQPLPPPNHPTGPHAPAGGPFYPLHHPTAAAPTPAHCPACRATRPCPHFSGFLPCFRPVTPRGDHPPCLRCPPFAAADAVAAPFAAAAATSGATSPAAAAGPKPEAEAEAEAGAGAGAKAKGAGSPAPRPLRTLVVRRSSSASSSAGSSAGSSSSRVAPPPAPNPFSPLSTPELSTLGGGSVSGGSVAAPGTPRGDAGEEGAGAARRASVVSFAEEVSVVGGRTRPGRRGVKRGGRRLRVGIWMGIADCVM
ncbi:9689f04a-9b22-4d14-b8c3-a76173800c3e [Thermothielavioides terrestris]|uniref:9689f04a-9b22-4d14-b8c3-a76173800c3e n=1 Tax=Thermothielavioides terrestris TaxID=2587410 RepID=A0A446BG96_9PEZI|nr:9689f04a-9b22-4d14-b8c3-a76173800c3e [Thermothielavioides terrestris]